jgi:hypothetical protein
MWKFRQGQRLTALILLGLLAFGSVLFGQTTQRFTPPAITFIEFPRTIMVGDDTVIGRVYYEDLENDVVRAEFRVISSIDFRSFNLDLTEQLQNDGVFDFFEFDIFPSSADDVTVEVVVFDEAELESSPRRFSFTILGPNGEQPGEPTMNEGEETGGTSGGLFPTTEPSTPTAEIRVEPPTLRFDAEPNGANPTQQAILITSRTADNTSFFWKATVDVSWLSLSRSDGPAPSTVLVRADITGLSAGVHQGTITVSSENTVNEEETVFVTLVLSDSTTTTTTTTTTDEEGQLIVLVFQSLEFVEPANWTLQLQAGCLVHTNRSTTPSTVRIILTDESVRIFEIPSNNQIVVCGTTVLVDTR